MIYSIAGLTVELQFKYEYGEEKCKRYQSEGIPVFSASATDEEIKKESLLIPGNPLHVAEFDAVFRKLYSAAPKFGRILMHGGALALNGQGFLFAAPSGTGKTTHMRLWGKKYENDVTIIDGDKPFIGFENDRAYVWGTPRCGKEGWNNPVSFPIKGIAFLQRADENKITPVSPAEIIEEAFIQFYFPKNKEASEITARMIEKLLTSVPLYRLCCNKEVEAAEVAYEGMK